MLEAERKPVKSVSCVLAAHLQRKLSPPSRPSGKTKRGSKIDLVNGLKRRVVKSVVISRGGRREDVQGACRDPLPHRAVQEGRAM